MKIKIEIDTSYIGIDGYKRFVIDWVLPVVPRAGEEMLFCEEDVGKEISDNMWTIWALEWRRISGEYMLEICLKHIEEKADLWNRFN